MSDAPSHTPEYDALCETIANGVAYGREHGGIHPVTAGLMKIRGKAITAGQRAGERAYHRAYDAIDRRIGEGGRPTASDRQFASDAARAASARARERYTIKALTA